MDSEVFSRRRWETTHSSASCIVRRTLIADETSDFIGIRAGSGSWVRLNEALTCPAKPCTCPRVINVTPASVRGPRKSSGTLRANPSRPGAVIRGSRGAKNNGVGVFALSPYLSIFVAAQDAARISMGLDDLGRTYRTFGIIVRIMKEKFSYKLYRLSCLANSWYIFVELFILTVRFDYRKAFRILIILI